MDKITKQAKQLLIKLLVNAIHSANDLDIDFDDINEDREWMENDADEAMSDEGDMEFSDSDSITGDPISDLDTPSDYTVASDNLWSDKKHQASDSRIYIKNMRKLIKNSNFKPFLTLKFREEIKESFTNNDTSLIIPHLNGILKKLKKTE